MKTLKLAIALVLGILIGGAFSYKVNVIAKPAGNTIPLAGIRTFSQVFKSIKDDYVKEVSDQDLINNAIIGMVSKLDPHSSYLLPSNYKNLTISTTGKFGGLGIEVGMQNGFVKVVSPIDDTPAMKAGLKAGDLIIRINDKSVQGMSLNDAINLMRGKVNTPINITIVREGVDKPFVVKIIRDVITIKSVRSKLLDQNFGYIRISQFQSKTKAGLEKEIKKLVAENKNKDLKGLILDLRNNPGGLLTSAVEVSDAFLEKGKIVFTKGRNKNSKTEFNASKTTISKEIPLIVIINSGSASASEIVAGALQDHKRAIIVGSKSFGKGSVQTLMPMEGGTGLKLTTALYYTPSGRSIQAEGIKPDIEIHPVKIDAKASNLAKYSVSEKNLSGHLDNGKKENTLQEDFEKAKETSTKSAKVETRLIETDFVLYESLNLLKGIALLK